jgi:APA family basic amino acid/polyamine antiporter
MQKGSQLKRALGLGMVIVIVVSNIIGSGVYKKVGKMSAGLHSSGWVLICWALAGVITLFGALSNAEVAGLLATTGGEYAYFKVIYNKFFAFIYGWSLFTTIQTAAISGLAYVFAESLSGIVRLPAVLPGLSRINIAGEFYPFADCNIKLCAIALVVVFTLINCRGIKMGAAFSRLLLILVVAGILVIIVFGLSSHQAHIANAFIFRTENNSPVRIGSIFTAMLAAFWAYQGWAAVGFVGGEVRDAKRVLPVGIACGVLLVIAIYMVVNTTYLSLLSVHELTRIAGNQNAIAATEAVKVFWGQGGGLFLSALIAVTTMGCMHATILASCRPYYIMASEGLFFRPAAKLNSAGVPAGSLFYQGGWACVLILSGTFDQLTDMIVFAVFMYYGATTLGVFILRRKMPDAPRSYKVPGYPVVPAIFILFCVGLFFNTLHSQPREALMGLALIASGVPFYLLFQHRLKKAIPVNPEL